MEPVNPDVYVHDRPKADQTTPEGQDHPEVDWTGLPEVRCILGSVSYDKNKKLYFYRCKARDCGHRVQPHSNDPLFSLSAGSSSTPLNKQVSALYCAVAGVPCQATHLILDMDHKPVEKIYTALDAARRQYVLLKEKDIKFGGKWEDCEADEVDIGKFTDDNLDTNKNTTWEQWGGLVQRGNRLRFFFSDSIQKPHPNEPQAQGPIRKREWLPVANKHLQVRKVILHTDGARAYTLKLPGVHHCNVAPEKDKPGQWERNSVAIYGHIYSIYS